MLGHMLKEKKSKDENCMKLYCNCMKIELSKAP